MNLQGKIWGETRRLLKTPLFEMHGISVLDGTYCSKHKHAAKYNWFYVISGRLRIQTWQNGLADETDLGPGDACVVPPGKYHRFKGLADTEALEAYWCELDTDDIEREDRGGKD